MKNNSAHDQPMEERRSGSKKMRQFWKIKINDLRSFSITGATTEKKLKSSKCLLKMIASSE
jgi:hypothetical protein